jgi:hypothetical protein
MSFRRSAVTVFAATAFTALSGLAMVATAGVAGAAGPAATVITNDPDPATGLTVSPNTPYSSGQTVEVSWPANSVLSPTISVKIFECADPGGLPANLPTSLSGCDTSTQQGDQIFTNPDGSYDYVDGDNNGDSGYQVFALPKPVGSSPIICGTSAVPCALWIGNNYSTAFTVNLWSQPFQVQTKAVTAAGVSNPINPGDGTPEVPLAVGLPLAAAGLFAGGLALRRRRSARAAA